MSVTFLGSMTLGDALPGAVSVAAAGVAGINGALPDILARIAALQAFLPTPVDFTAQLALAQQTLQSVQATILLGLPVPDISAQLLAVQALIASLLAAVSAVNAQLDLITNFQAILGESGIYAYASDGTLSNLGAELSSALSTTPGLSGAMHANSVILVAASPSAWAAMQAVLVTP